MHNLILLPNEINMTSLEIAELTGKQHSNVCRDIRNQLEQQKLDQFIFESIFLDSYNREQKCYSLDYEQLMILVSGYSIPLRAKIIKRWTELENQNKPALPTHIEALRLYADQLETNQLLIQQQEADKPKVQFYETVTQQGNWLTAKELSNVLAIPELGRNNLLKRLREMKCLTQFNKPYQRFIDQKLIKLAEDEKGRTFPLFSQKFLERIIKEIN